MCVSNLPGVETFDECCGNDEITFVSSAPIDSLISLISPHQYKTSMSGIDEISLAPLVDKVLKYKYFFNVCDL